MSRFSGVCVLTIFVAVYACTERSLGHEVYPAVLAEQLNHYCAWKTDQGNKMTRNVTYRGKAGPIGPPGPRGPAGNVDYGEVKRLINEGNDDQNEELAILKEKVARLEKAFLNLSTRSCKDVSDSDAKISNETGGVFDIYPKAQPMEVYCDQAVDGGGWIVFQRRMDGSEDFERNFVDYELGFGRREGEFWLGLKNLHLLTKNGAELRVDITDWDGNKAYAKYSTFIVGDTSSQYRLTAGGYSGTAGDALTYHNDQKFHTKDRDRNLCSKKYKGGMWYNACHYVNLNGIYINGGTYSGAHGVEWYQYKGRYGYSLKFAEMKLRPKNI